MAEERELKLAISEDDARRLLDLWGPPVRTLLQRNDYFDSPDGRLRQARYGLRLRAEGPRRTLTLKGPTRRDVDLAVRSEDEADISHAEADRILLEGLDPQTSSLPALRQLALRLGVSRVEVLGGIENERTVLVANLGGDRVEILLDRTRYPDGSIDLELEMECPVGGAWVPELRGRLDATGIPWRPRREGKFSRFLARGGASPRS